jgi:hypothetical protein
LPTCAPSPVHSGSKDPRSHPLTVVSGTSIRPRSVEPTHIDYVTKSKSAFAAQKSLIGKVCTCEMQKTLRLMRNGYEYAPPRYLRAVRGLIESRSFWHFGFYASECGRGEGGQPACPKRCRSSLSCSGRHRPGPVVSAGGGPVWGERVRSHCWQGICRAGGDALGLSLTS